MPDVARLLCGEPNPRLSSATEWRYGNRGSLSVDLTAGTFYCHELADGGGVVDLIRYKVPEAAENGGVARWISENLGIEDEDTRPKAAFKAVASWDYHDADGAVQYTVTRRENGEGDKTYRQLTARGLKPSADAAFVPLPYRLPEMLAAPDAVVYIAEGEKAADALRAAGLVATTNSGGAGNWDKQGRLNHWFEGRQVVILPDNDEPGRRHAGSVARHLGGVAAAIKVVELSRLPEKGDAVDYLRARSVENLLAEVREAAGLEDAQEYRGVRATGFSAERMRQVKPREWLYGRHLIAGYVSTLISPGGAGKTTIVLTEAIALATGRDLLGHQAPRRCKVWHYNLEDPLDELYRRVWAICDHFKIDATELEGWLYLDSGRDRKLIVAERDASSLVAMPASAEVIAEMQQNEIAVLQVDPFIKVHHLNENDNVDIDFVCSLFADIAKTTGGAVELVHHVRKAQKGDTTAGDIDSARGASALSGAVRAARTLAIMSAKEAEGFGLPAERRGWYLRADDAKQNMSAPAARAEWYERQSVQIENGEAFEGDSVGVLTRWEPPSLFDGLSNSAARTALLKISGGLSNGQRYKMTQRGGTERWCGFVVMDEGTDIGVERARMIVREWAAHGMIYEEEYEDTTRRSKTEKGVFVDHDKLPGTDA